MLGFLLLSPFLVVFLPSCALEGPRQEQGGHFSTWAVTGQGQSGLCWESRAAVTWKRSLDARICFGSTPENGGGTNPAALGGKRGQKVGIAAKGAFPGVCVPLAPVRAIIPKPIKSLQMSSRWRSRFFGSIQRKSPVWEVTGSSLLFPLFPLLPHPPLP